MFLEGIILILFLCHIAKQQSTNIVCHGLSIFSLISLFNGISAFVDHLKPKLSLGKNSRDTSHNRENKGINTFLVFLEMVHFSNTINYLATRMNNKTSFKQHSKERFIIVAGVKEWE